VRDRKLPFGRVVSYLLNQVKGAHQRELDDTFDALWPTSQRVSAAAFCNARKNLCSTVFEFLNAQFIAQVGDRLPHVRFGDRRVFAVDSTVLNLPAQADCYRHFGGNEQNSKRYPMARCSTLIECDSQLTWHSVLQPYELGEAVAAADHIEHLPTDSVTLYDRGYPSFFMFALHQMQSRDVCMRIPRGFSADTDAVFASALATTTVTLKPNAEARALCKEHDIPCTPIRLRAVRVELPTEVEVLLTSLLDTEAYPDETFGALYHRRWTIEGDFRHLKSRLQIENWTGKSVLSVKQDVAARILTKNLVAYVIAMAQQTVDLEVARRRAAGDPLKRRRINKTAALHQCKFVLLAYLLSPTPQALDLLITKGNL
jgi:hypothetical protein